MSISIQELTNKIKTKYEKLDSNLGWSMLYTPETTLFNPVYPIAFLGLNPGGGNEESFSSGEHDCFDSPDGNDYLIGNWGNGEGESPLQKQVQYLYKELHSKWGITGDFEDLMHHSLAANFVPFRSQSWSNLDNKQELIKFSRSVWKDCLESTPRAVYFTMAQQTYDQIISILLELGYTKSEPDFSDLVGWGKVKYQTCRLEYKGKETVIIRFPHLSRYKIFNRPKSSDAINNALQIAVNTLNKW